MVISAKSLLDVEKTPTRKQINQVIRGNICRCTGYKKIVEAIELAAKCFRGEEEPILSETVGKVGERSIRPDAKDKILGTGKFAADIKAEGMVYGSALRSQYPRALVKAIDISKALKHPDAVCIVRAKDVPGERACF